MVFLEMFKGVVSAVGDVQQVGEVIMVVIGRGSELFIDHDLVDIGGQLHILEICGGEASDAVFFPDARDQLVEDHVLCLLAVECDVV